MVLSPRSIVASRRFALAAAMLATATSCSSGSSGGERVCKTIDRSGGLITSHDSVLSLSFRPSSLSETTEVCISPADRPPNGPPFVYGAAYRVTPDVDLQVDVSVTYRLDLPNDTSQTAIGVVRRADFEAGQGRWLSLPLTRLDPENKLVGGTDTRLSMFYGLLDDGGDGMVNPTVASTDPTTTDPTTSGPTTDTNDPTTDTTTDETDTNNVDTDPGTETESTTGETDDPTIGETDEDTDPTTTSESDTATVDCDNLPAGPYDVTEIFNAANGAEDLAMTNGGMVLASGGAFVELDGDGNATTWFDPIPGAGTTFGVAFLADGRLLSVFGNQTNDIYAFTPPADGPILFDAGAALGQPNGMYIDNDDIVWITDFGDNRIVRYDSGAGTAGDVLNGAMNVNGIFHDEERGLLFWTLYNASQLWSAPVDGTGALGAATMVAELAGTSDGVTMDACGNAYVVDQNFGGLCRIDRINLDAAGAEVSTEEIAGDGILGMGCSNAKFGYGFGSAYDQALFVTSPLGQVSRVDVGVPGYPIPLPE